jgi:hypothetical protein
VGNGGRAGRGLVGSGAADPVQSLSGGVVQRGFTGAELGGEARGAVMRGAAASAANRDGCGVAALPESSGQRGDKVLACP